MTTLSQFVTSIGAVPLVEIMLFVTLTALLLILLYIQIRRDSLDLRFLILDENGNPSIHKLGQAIALIISSWGFVYQVLAHQLTEWYATMYLAVWAGSTALNTFLTSKRSTI